MSSFVGFFKYFFGLINLYILNRYLITYNIKIKLSVDQYSMSNRNTLNVFTTYLKKEVRIKTLLDMNLKRKSFIKNNNITSYLYVININMSTNN